MHLLYARSATIGHEVRYAITLIKLTFLFTFQVRAGYTVNIYMYKTIEARVNTVAIPTTGKSCNLYWELLHPILGIPLSSIGKLPFVGKLPKEA